MHVKEFNVQVQPPSGMCQAKSLNLLLHIARVLAPHSLTAAGIIVAHV